VDAQQLDQLHGFFVALWCYYHKKTGQFDHKYWADRLDQLEISWSIQNAVAIAAENREINYIYFSTLIDRLNIIRE